MAFTYTPGATTDATRVRLLIGDTDPDAPLQQRLENEEITDLLTIYGGYRAAAPAAAEALAAKFARLATEKSMGRASLAWKRFEQLSALAVSLRTAVSLSAVPFCGGYSKTLRDNNEQNTDLIAHSFKKGMLDNPSTMSNCTTSTAS